MAKISLRLKKSVLRSSLGNLQNPGDFRVMKALHFVQQENVALVLRQGGQRAFQRHSERRMRAGIAALPDGRFEGHDVLEAIGGDLEVRATVSTVADSRAVVRFGRMTRHSVTTQPAPRLLDASVSVLRSRDRRPASIDR